MSCTSVDKMVVLIWVGVSISVVICVRVFGFVLDGNTKKLTRTDNPMAVDFVMNKIIYFFFIFPRKKGGSVLYLESLFALQYCFANAVFSNFLEGFDSFFRLCLEWL